MVTSHRFGIRVTARNSLRLDGDLPPPPSLQPRAGQAAPRSRGQRQGLGSTLHPSGSMARSVQTPGRETAPYPDHEILVCFLARGSTIARRNTLDSLPETMSPKRSLTNKAVLCIESSKVRSGANSPSRLANSPSDLTLWTVHTKPGRLIFRRHRLGPYLFQISVPLEQIKKENAYASPQ